MAGTQHSHFWKDGRLRSDATNVGKVAKCALQTGVISVVGDWARWTSNELVELPQNRQDVSIIHLAIAAWQKTEKDVDKEHMHVCVFERERETDRQTEREREREREKERERRRERERERESRER